MASPYTIAAISDVPATGESSLLEGKSGRTVEGQARVQVYMNREAVGVLVDIFVGSARTMVAGIVPINATVGDAPSTRDDLVVDTFAFPGDEIVIRATNSTAGALEARAIVFVTEVDDVALQSCMAQLQATGGIIG